MTVTDSTTPAADTTAPPLEGEVLDAPAKPEPEKATENAVVGEVVKPELSKAEARKLTAQIKKDLNSTATSAEAMNKALNEAADLMAEAYGKKVWLSLDFGSWEDYVAAELGEVRIRLERTVRQGLVYQMAQKELSTRAVAAIIGVDQKTVSNDLRQIRRERGEDAPSTVKTRAGKTQKTATARKPRVKPIEDRFAAAIEKLDGPIGDLVSLSVEDGFDDVAGAIAKTHRRDVARLIDSLRGVQERMQGGTA